MPYGFHLGQACINELARIASVVRQSLCCAHAATEKCAIWEAPAAGLLQQARAQCTSGCLGGA
eukprot:scaffold113449_cov21-Tisochrysis_lutea.AAC.1